MSVCRPARRPSGGLVRAAFNPMVFNGIEPTTLLLQTVLRLQFFKSIDRLDLDGMTGLGPIADTAKDNEARGLLESLSAKGSGKVPAAVQNHAGMCACSQSHAQSLRGARRESLARINAKCQAGRLSTCGNGAINSPFSRSGRNNDDDKSATPTPATAALASNSCVG
jgi:hypothetical protein